MRTPRETHPPIPALLTPREVAAALRVSEASAYRYLAAGVLPAVRVGGLLRVRADELARLVGEDGSAPAHGAAPTTEAGRVRPGHRHSHSRSAS